MALMASLMAFAWQNALCFAGGTLGILIGTFGGRHSHWPVPDWLGRAIFFAVGVAFMLAAIFVHNWN